MGSVSTSPAVGAAGYPGGTLAVSLEVAGVSKRFGTTTAVDGVSLSVSEGEVVGLLGPNGAGKSTTLRIIAGLVRADAGRVRLGGHDLTSDRLRALESAGFLVEGPALPGELSCVDALRYLGLLGRPGGVAAARIAEVLGTVGLSDATGKRVQHLSLGMKQRLGLAAALLGRPRVLVLDEPTNGLDPPGIRQMGALLRDLARAGAAVLVSSHLLDEVERIADRVAVMARGKIVATEPVAAAEAGRGALARLFFSVTGTGAGGAPP
jgi:ABC-2 type transport system ATP-binding protein